MEVSEKSEMFEIATPIKTTEEVTPMALLQMAIAQGANLDRLEKFMELHLRWEKRAELKAYFKAVAAFKLESFVISKDGEVGYRANDGKFVGYKHATLGNVIGMLTPAMSKHGLSLSWDPQQIWDEKLKTYVIKITCKMSHEQGHTQEVSLFGKGDNTGNKNQLQQLGSTMTYLERYTALAITGTATQEMDDDGRAGGGSDEEDRDTNKDQDTNNDQGGADEKPIILLGDDDFDRHLARWKKSIKAGTMSVTGVFVGAKEYNYKFSPEQIEKINRIGENDEDS